MNIVYILGLVLLQITVSKSVIFENQSKLLNVVEYPGDECYRTCQNNDTRICYFKFVMEHYQAMGPACGKCAEGVIEDCFNVQCLPVDGIERGVMSINRQIPGPSIHVCKNDLIVVDVVNMMAGTATTLHWHGIHMRKTPWMDGVPFVTQCPISFGTTFRYAFEASEAGTQFYHSHSGHHKMNGHYGQLIVRQSIKNDPHKRLYDYDLKEHTILISDWQHHDADMFMPGLPSRDPGINPQNLLINGKGVYKKKEQMTPNPVEVYKVQTGNKYRFRLINAAGHACPIQLQIQDHNITIIATDSFDVKPMTVDTLYTAGGERYDFIVDANQKAGNYCIKILLIGECDCTTCEQYAILAYNKDGHMVKIDDYKQYRTHVDKCFDTKIETNVRINHPNSDCVGESSNDKCVTELSGLDFDQDLIRNEPDERFYLPFYYNYISVQDLFRENNYEPFLNAKDAWLLQISVSNITLTLPPVSILTQMDALTDKSFCSADNLPEDCKPGKICYCPHLLNVKLNSSVELVLVDETNNHRVNHPFHLHGTGFHIVDMGQSQDQPMTVELYKKWKRTNSLPSMMTNRPPVVKDTVSLPVQGYATLRFRAINPGIWIFHCHFEYHSAVGMGLLIKVGESSDFIEPPSNFPKCNNFVPEIRAS